MSFVPLVFWHRIDEVFSVPKLIAVCLTALLGLGFLVWESPRAFMPVGFGWVEWSALTYLGLAGVATMTSVDPGLSLVGEPLQRQGLLAVAAYVVAFVVGRRVFVGRRQFSLLMQGIAVAGVAVAAYAVAQRLDWDPIWDQLIRGRVFSSLGQPNALGAYLVLVAPVMVGLAVLPAQTRALRILALGGAGASVAGIGLSMSRGALLGLAASVLVLGLVFLRARTLRKVAMWTLGSMIGIVILAAIIGPIRDAVVEVWERGTSIADLDGYDARQRLALWDVGISITVDHPLLGTGPDTYAAVFDDYRDRVLDPYWALTLAAFRPESPHNAYIAIGAGAGIPAMAAFVIARCGGLIVILLAALRAPPGWRRTTLGVIAASLAGHAMADAFITAELAGSFTAWVLLGAGVGLGRPPEQQDLPLTPKPNS